MDLKKKFKKTLYILVYCLLLLNLVIFVDSHTEIIVYDNFECGDFSCGSGWVGNWSYTGDCEVNDENDPIEAYHLVGSKSVADSSGCRAERKVNFSDYELGENISLQFFAKGYNLEAVDNCLYIYYDGSVNHTLLNLTDGDERDYQSFIFSSEDYVYSENSSFIFYSKVDGSQDHCYLDNFFFGDISLFEEDIKPPPPFKIDFNNLSNVILLFILLLAYLGLMIIGFMFHNGGFIVFGFFIGVVLGFMLSGFHIFLTLLFIFMNISILWSFIKKR